MNLWRDYTTCLLIAVFLFSYNFNHAQSGDKDFQVLFQQGNQILPENGKVSIRKNDLSSNEIVNGYYYRLIQFYNLPSSTERSIFEQEGVIFLEYIPHNVYLLAIPASYDVKKLPVNNVRSFVPLQSNHKIANTLLDRPFEKWAKKGDQIKVVLRYFDNIKPQQAKSLAERAGLSIFQYTEKANILKIFTKEDQIEAIASLPFVQYLELISPPSEPEDLTGRALHRTNTVDTDFPTGRKYNGDGVNVLVRDDGIVGPHIDYTGRLEVLSTQDAGLNHADGVAGVLGGAGNLNQANKATAAGTFIYVTDYEADFLDTTLGLHQTFDVKITNSSYSNGCNVGYTTITETVDQQIYENQTLVHVFSAGNSNGQDCGYGAGNQWGNITGGHKQGKNTVTVGNLSSIGNIIPSSSRGPGHDGRIKPDICSNGADYLAAYPNNTYEPFGGTSGAAPGIAGTMAIMYQAYRELNGGADPNSGFIKAVLMNTANDLGNRGPDFIYGWGHVNALRAIRVLENETYLNDEIDQGESNTHEITLPDNVKELNVMVYWTESSASPMTSKALINNLDMQMAAPGGDVSLPWLLDPTADPVNLNAPATKGFDDLNNVEQITLENPEAGTYSIQIDGTEVPMGPQEYYIVYEIVTEEITMTYPIGGESFEPFSTERLHWDAFGDNGEFTLEYTTDGGLTWNMIGTAAADSRMFDWNVPNELTGQAQVRITRDGVSDVSDANFSIANVPVNVAVTKVCPDYIQVLWAPTAGATGYEVFLLGERYMDSVGTTNSVIFNIPITFPFEEQWIAVRSLGPNGMRSRRSIAISYTGFLENCQQENDLAANKIDAGLTGFITGCEDLTSNLSFTFTNEGSQEASNFDIYYQINNDPPVMVNYPGTVAPEEMIDFDFPDPFTISNSGVYTVKAWTDLNPEDFVYNDTLEVSFEFYNYANTPSITPTYTQDFEMNTFPPTDWLLTDPDDTENFWSRRENVIGINGDTTAVAWINNFNNNDQGSEYIMSLPPLDLSGTTIPSLVFDYAYTFYDNTYQDGMRIDLSTDCGENYDVVLFDKTGAELSTIGGPSTGFFVPDEAEDWKKEVLDLSPYIGTEVLIRFVNINGWGNNLFVDNINLLEITAPTAVIEANALEVCDGDGLTFNAGNSGQLADYIWEFGPGAFPPTATGPGPHNVQFLTPGVNNVTMTATNPAGDDMAAQDITIIALPQASFTNQVTGFDVNFTNNSQDATTYFWDFGDTNTSSDENPTHTYSENGAYEVTLTASSQCGDAVFSDSIFITVNSITNLATSMNLEIVPNPSNGVFNLFIDQATGETAEFSLFTLDGKQMSDFSFQKDNSVNKRANYRFEAPNLPSGTYLLKAKLNDGIVTKKLIIQ